VTVPTTTEKGNAEKVKEPTMELNPTERVPKLRVAVLPTIVHPGDEVRIPTNVTVRITFSAASGPLLITVKSYLRSELRGPVGIGSLTLSSRSVQGDGFGCLGGDLGKDGLHELHRCLHGVVYLDIYTTRNISNLCIG